MACEVACVWESISDERAREERWGDPASDRYSERGKSRDDFLIGAYLRLYPKHPGAQFA